MVQIGKLKASFYGKRTKNIIGLNFKNKKEFTDYLKDKDLSGRTTSDNKLRREVINELAIDAGLMPLSVLGMVQENKLNNKLSRFNFEFDPPPASTKKDFYKSIIFHLNFHNKAHVSFNINVFFRNPQNPNMGFARSISGHTWEGFRDRVKDIEENGIDGNTQGSDAENAGYVMDNTIASVWMINKSQAGGVRTNLTIKIISKYYLTKNFNSKDNNCILAPIKFILKDKSKLAVMRRKLGDEKGIPSATPIEVNDIPLLEDVFKININILSDDERDHYYYKSLNKEEKTVDILLKDGHYCLITARKKIKEEVVKAPVKKEYYLFFDIETIFDKNHFGYLKPYSVAWMVWDKEEEFKYKGNESKILKKCHFKTMTAKCDNPLEHLFKYIMYEKEINGEPCKFKIIGFNNSRFDNFFLADVAQKFEALGSVFFVNNSILDFRICGSTSFDLCRFINDSLKNACDNFNTYPKKLDGFSHREPQIEFEKGTLLKWIKNNYSKLEEYNKVDVLCLCDLTMKLKKTVSVLTNNELELTEYMTIGQMGYKFNEMKLIENDLIMEAPLTYDDDKFIRSALTAGRTQCYYGKQKFDMPLRMIDVKSLYPYVMMNRSFPIGQYEKTDKYQRGKCGIYECKIVHQNLLWKGKGIHEFFIKYPQYKNRFAPIVYPKRSNDISVALDWEYRGDLECRLTNVDIECIREYGGNVKVISGLYWKESNDKLFTYYLEIFMNEKNKQDEYKKVSSLLYNPCLREFCKLMSNCLSGKVIQKNYSDMFELIRNNKELDKFMEKVEEDTIKIMNHGGSNIYMCGKKKDDLIYKSQNAKPSYLGVFIYAYARDYMYRTILGSYCAFYEDTDSALLPKVEYERFIKENPEKYANGQYGCLEEEVGNATLAYTFAPKFYCVINREDDHSKKCKEKCKCKSKYKLKGIRKSDNYLLDSQLDKPAREMTEEEIEQKFFENAHNKTLTEKMFEDIYNGETLNVFQSQLQKIKGEDCLLGIKKKDKDLELNKVELKIKENSDNKEIMYKIKANKKIIKNSVDDEEVIEKKEENEELEKKLIIKPDVMNVSGFQIKQRYLVKVLKPQETMTIIKKIKDNKRIIKKSLNEEEIKEKKKENKELEKQLLIK